MVKNFVFDMGGVLVYFEQDRIMNAWGLQGEDRVRIRTEVFRSVEWIMLDRGTITFEAAAEAMCARLPEHLHQAAREISSGWYDRALEPIPGMKELLGELKAKGYDLYILSNANADFDAYIGRVPGKEYMTGTFASAHYKLLKPEHEIYETFLKTFGLKAEECCFIDDNANNVEAAIRCGWKGVVGYQNAERLRRELQAAAAE